MIRLWGRMIKDNRLVKDAEVIREDDTRTHSIFNGLEELCVLWDLGKPIWLDSNVRDFKKHAKTRFYQDSFIEVIDFDYLEFRILDED